MLERETWYKQRQADEGDDPTMQGDPWEQQLGGERSVETRERRKEKFEKEEKAGEEKVKQEKNKSCDVCPPHPW